jgi:hypothetical protein
MSNNITKRVAITLHEPTYKQLKEICLQERVSYDTQVRRMLTVWCSSNLDADSYRSFVNWLRKKERVIGGV